MNEGNQWHLGRSSERYESGGRGPGTISSGVGDAGGVSYGQYQLSSARGTVAEYLAWSRYGHTFDGLEVNSTAFKDRWRELAREDAGFGVDQHDFIKTRHYDVQVARMKESGLDLSDRGPAVQDAIWSTAVQYRGFTPAVFQNALDEKFGGHADLHSVSDEQIVETVQDYKERTVERYFSGSESLWPSLRNRAAAEKETLSDFARTGEFIASAPVSRHRGSQAERPLAAGSSGEKVMELQEQLQRLGYLSSDGVSLRPDGDFGPRTREAVVGFQRTNGLAVDGVAGEETLRSLRAQAQHTIALDNPLHRDHAFFSQVRGHVVELDKTLGRTPDQFTDNIAAALTVQARADGLHRIDQIALSPDGTKLWGVQTPLGRDDHLFDLRTSVPTAEAATTMEQSAALWPQAMQHFEQHEQERAPMHERSQAIFPSAQETSPPHAPASSAALPR